MFFKENAAIDSVRAMPRNSKRKGDCPLRQDPKVTGVQCGSDALSLPVWTHAVQVKHAVLRRKGWSEAEWVKAKVASGVRIVAYFQKTEGNDGSVLAGNSHRSGCRPIRIQRRVNPALTCRGIAPKPVLPEGLHHLGVGGDHWTEGVGAGATHEACCVV